MSETEMKIQPPLKWHGGKSYLASRIIELMPPHIHYVEPFFGGGAVLLAKDPEGVSEVVNDLNYELTNFWTALQREECFAEMKRRLESTPFSQIEWEGAGPESKDYGGGMTGMACAFFVRCRQSMAGRMQSFSPLSRTRTRRNMNEQASSWMTAVDGLPQAHARLRRVAILNDDAAKVIKQQDGPATFFYCDPPYIPESRSSPDVYEKEMTREQHAQLLDTLGGIEGKFILSGYDDELYRQAETRYRWHRREFDLPNNSASGKIKQRKTEVLWANYSLSLVAEVA